MRELSFCATIATPVILSPVFGRRTPVVSRRVSGVELQGSFGPKEQGLRMTALHMGPLIFPNSEAKLPWLQTPKAVAATRKM